VLPAITRLKQDPKTSYANWFKAQHFSYSSDGIKHLVEGVAQDECITGPIDSKETGRPNGALAIQTVARTQNLESGIHAVERFDIRGGRQIGAAHPDSIVSQ